VADDLDLGPIDLIAVRVIEWKCEFTTQRIGFDVIVFSSSRSAQAPPGVTCESTTRTSLSPSMMAAFDITTRLPVPTAWCTPSAILLNVNAGPL
jgi:hypothetical protein